MTDGSKRTAPALKSYVTALGLKQAELGKIWGGMTRVQVGRIINCRSGFGSNHARSLCRYIGFPEQDFSRLYEIPADPIYFAQHGVEWKGEVPAHGVMPLSSRFSFQTIDVIGSVQAGVFTEALEWDTSRRYSIQIPVDDGYPLELERYALEVKGESMNRVFPDGSLVSVINFEELGRPPETGDFEELGRPPETGDYVVVMRRDSHGPGFEATIKALQIRDDGSVCLWPQSTDPNFQQPFILPAPDLDCPECAGVPDIHIKGLVVSSIKTRLKATF